MSSFYRELEPVSSTVLLEDKPVPAKWHKILFRPTVLASGTNVTDGLTSLITTPPKA